MNEATGKSQMIFQCIALISLLNLFNFHQVSSFLTQKNIPSTTTSWSQRPIHPTRLHNNNEETNGFLPPLRNSNKLKKDMESLYTSDELQNVLNTHFELQNQYINQYDQDNDSFSEHSFSLHDLVQMAIETPDDETKSSIFTESRSGSISQTIMESKAKSIRVVASDVDGTLLSSKQSLHPSTLSGIQQTLNLGITFFPATGKSRKGALDSIGSELSTILNNGCPGVYLQGLYCLDSNGNIVFEQKLNSNAITAAYNLAIDRDVSFIGYDGDDLYTHEMTPIVEHLHTHYGEPLAVTVDVTTKNLHKILLMHDDISVISQLRPLLEEVALQTNATVTQAIPTMLELLPSNCSKALGVQKVCSSLGVTIPKISESLLALGDAENDAEMLRMAAIGIAVANACDVAKGAADFVLDVSNDNGAVGSALELFLRYRNSDNRFDCEI